MDQKGELISAFANCFRLLAKIEAGIRDGFFYFLIDNKSDELLKIYIQFLNKTGMAINLQDKNISKFYIINRRIINVAQCQQLILKIDELLSLLSTLNYLKLISDNTIPLLTQKNLLSLKSLILDLKKEFMHAFGFNKRKVAITKKFIDNKQNNKLTEVHNEIAEFVKNKDRIQNTDIFVHFSEISRRTLKRKLSDLVKFGVIKRAVYGRKVFYVHD